MNRIILLLGLAIAAFAQNDFLEAHNQIRRQERGAANMKMMVVWADSDALGCGVAYCRNLFGGRGGYNYVCNYGPAGNWNGKKPYIAGRQCSRCPRGYRCQNGLCAKSAWK
uniref:Peptidase inhibitor 16 n=1 Tax=Magallana gigas TaxID=29159 RepID=K1Q376_MAGGI